MVVVLLYMAFRSLVDVVLVLSNVLALFCGGIWALLLTGTNFSISAAVGFISIFGVAIMNGLLLVSFFHRLRLEGIRMEEAILQGSPAPAAADDDDELTAIFGLLPAALVHADRRPEPAAAGHRGHRRHDHGAAAEPYLTPVLYSVFRRRPPDPEAAGLAE